MALPAGLRCKAEFAGTAPTAAATGAGGGRHEGGGVQPVAAKAGARNKAAARGTDGQPGAAGPGLALRIDARMASVPSVARR